MNQYLDIDYLKKNYTKIHGFGLGFIQIKLGEVFRVHIYTSKVSLTTQAEEIHNHRYNFKSTVLKGLLTNKLYQINPSPTGEFILVDEACNPNIPKTQHHVTVDTPKLISEFKTPINTAYFLDKDTFHQVESQEGTITLVERGPVVKPMAQIVYPKNQINTCPFSSNLPEAELWEITKEYL